MRSTLRLFEIRFEKYDLVIADKLGYISIDKEGHVNSYLPTYLYGQRGEYQ